MKQIKPDLLRVLFQLPPGADDDGKGYYLVYYTDGEQVLKDYDELAPECANAQMRFTFNGKVFFADAVATSEENVCVFTFSGIAPQCMGDNIKAEVVIDGMIVSAKAEYSVLQNVKNIINDDNKYLIYDLLSYGAAAQKYAGYKTDALVNAGYEALASKVGLITSADRMVSASLGSAKFVAAGVYHANTNKLYAKIEADDISAVTITINGKEASAELYSDGMYIVYTDSIKVTEYDDVYTFVIIDENGNSQTLTYSVNAWCAEKYDAERLKPLSLQKHFMLTDSLQSISVLLIILSVASQVTARMTTSRVENSFEPYRSVKIY